MIYSLLNKHSANWLHEKGFKYEKRSFKLFTFSSILERGQYEKKHGIFIFPKKISFYVSSPVNWILEQVAQNFVVSENFRIGPNNISISSISVLKMPNISERIIVKAITPISIRSTFLSEGKKYFHTYSPLDPKFEELINKNAKKKWLAFYGETCPYSLSIKPIFKNDKKYKRVIYYGNINNKKTIIEGWVGNYLLCGNTEFLKFAYDSGLGERNSQGFGLIEITDN